MLKQYLNLLVKFAVRKTSTRYQVVAVIIGGIIFLLVIPAIFYLIGFSLNKLLTFIYPSWLSIMVIALSIPVGLFFLFWATITQWKLGGGTPAPNAPTQKLIINGPYKLCRNPIEFGAVLYYLGVGTLVDTLTMGIIFCLLGLILPSSYHKFVEEFDLELRFGPEYLAYKKTTPFLIPGIFRRTSDN